MTHPPLDPTSGDPRRLTYEDYVLLPDDGKRYEIIDGELHVSPAATPLHQRVSRRIQFHLMLMLEQPKFGEVYDAPIDLLLDSHTVVQPDLLVIRTENLSIVGEKNLQGPPDLVVEILSPSSRRRDRLVKFEAYARLGVPSYWIVDPEKQTIEVYEKEGENYRLECRATPPGPLKVRRFPEVALPLAGLFD